MYRWMPLFLVAALLPRTGAASVRIEVGTVSARPGEAVVVPVLLSVDGGEEVAAVTNEISFDPATIHIAANARGNPDCDMDPQTEFVLAAFVYTPRDCDAARRECTAMRASILGLTRRGAIDGATLYTCRVEIDDSVGPGLLRLPNDRAEYSSEAGDTSPATAISGGVRVPGIPSVTSTPTRTLPAPTSTATPETSPTIPDVLAPGCTGDCDGTGSVSEAEVDLLAAAVFDAQDLAGCTLVSPADNVRVTAAHLVAAARALQVGCVQPPTPTETPPDTETPTHTRPPTLTLTPTEVPTPTITEEPPEPTATRTLRLRTPTPTATGTRTPRTTPTSTRTRFRTPTPTPTPTRARPTMTSTPSEGPVVSFLGIARADGRLLAPVGETEEGVLTYEVATGVGFKLVVEGAPSSPGSPVGTTTFVAELDDAPDVQVQVDRPLGNGSAAVCSGGVPAIDPPDFSETQNVINALNDFGCRLDPGICVSYADSSTHYVSPRSSVQFCAVVSNSFRFLGGITTVTARLRDRGGVPGPPAQIIVRVPG